MTREQADLYCINCNKSIANRGSTIFCDDCKKKEEQTQEYILFKRLMGEPTVEMVEQYTQFCTAFRSSSENTPVQGFAFREYNDLSSHGKRLIDNMCGNKRVFAFLAVCISRAVYSGKQMTEAEVNELYIEMMGEK